MLAPSWLERRLAPAFPVAPPFPAGEPAAHAGIRWKAPPDAVARRGPTRRAMARPGELRVLELGEVGEDHGGEALDVGHVVGAPDDP